MAWLHPVRAGDERGEKAKLATGAFEFALGASARQGGLGDEAVRQSRGVCGEAVGYAAEERGAFGTGGAGKNGEGRRGSAGRGGDLGWRGFVIRRREGRVVGWGLRVKGDSCGRAGGAGEEGETVEFHAEAGRGEAERKAKSSPMP